MHPTNKKKKRQNYLGALSSVPWAPKTLGQTEALGSRVFWLDSRIGLPRTGLAQSAFASLSQLG